MHRQVHTNDLVLVQGIRDTRATLEGWQRDPWPVLGIWTAGALAVSCLLLFAVWVIGTIATPDSTRILLPGFTRPGTNADVLHILGRNSLVLALHAFACVAGFIAGSSLPRSAENYTGVWRWIHVKAGPLAIGFVVCATMFSLFTQAYVLGNGAATVAAQLEVTPTVLVASLIPHALPELVALFLPLAAWAVASRRGDWHQLLAATFVTVALAAPVLVICGFIEVYVWPRLLLG